MKKLFFFFVSFTCISGKAQDASLTKQINDIVEMINAKSIKVDTCKGLIRGNVYLDTLENNKPIKIVTQYQHAGQQITETFYFSDTTLVLYLRNETPGYLSDFKQVADKRYYFNDGNLLHIQPVELGKEKWISEEIRSMKNRLEKAKRTISRCLDN
jgi:hypothetical protein